MSRSRYHHGDLRTALINNGLEMIERGGATQLSLRALGRKIGVSANAALHHFDSKQHLLAAIATEGFRRMGELQREACGTETNPATRLVSLATVYVESARAHPQLFRLMTGDGLESAAAHPALVAARESAFADLDRALEAHLRQGAGWPPFDVARAGAWSLVHGIACLCIDRQLEPGRAALPDVPGLVATTCLAYLRGLVRPADAS